MLQNLREHAQGWIAVLIVVVLCFAFATWGIQYYLEGNHHSDVVAKVNGENITMVQFDSAYKRSRQWQKTDSLMLSPALQKQLKEQVLEDLIHKKALAQAALKEGFQISEQQLGSMILQIPDFQINGQFSRRFFQNVINNLLFTEQEFLTDLKQNMLILQVRLGLTSSDFVLPNEVDEMIKVIDQTRDMGYFVVPSSRFLKTVKVSPQAVKDYYQTHKNDFIVPEKVSIQYIQLSAPDLSSKLKITDEELKQYYQNNLGAFTTPEQWQVSRILVKLPANADQKTIDAAQTRINTYAQQIQSGQDFAKMATQFSEDRITGAHGGLMDWFGKTSQQSPMMVQIVSNLKPGQVSMPFRTDEGFNLVKLMAVKAPQVQAFDKVRAQVDKNLRQQKMEQIFADQSDKLSDLTYTHSDSLKPAADALNLPITTSDVFTQQGSKTGITANPKIITAAFSDNVLKQNNNSDVIQLNDETLVVLRIDQHKPAVLPTLADVRSTIERELQAEAAQNQAKEFGETLIAQIKKGTTPQQIAKQNNLDWHYQSAATRHAQGVPLQILNTGFSAPLSSASKQPAIDGVHLSNGDYAVVTVSNAVDGSPQLVNAQQRTVLQNSLASGLGQLTYDLYEDQVIKNAKIKIEQSQGE